MCVLVYKCLHQAAPIYLAELCSLVSESANHGHLRSAARGGLAVPCSRTTRYGQRCFSVSGATLWNSLPLSARDPSLTLTQFCARLKTVLFCRAYETLTQHLRDSLGCKDCCANINSLTYLLTVFSGIFRGHSAMPPLAAHPIFTVRLHVMQRTVLLSEFCLSVCLSVRPSVRQMRVL